MKKKIFFFTTNRADFGLQLNILKKFAKSKKFETTLIVTGSHFSSKFGSTYKEVFRLLPKNIKKIKVDVKNIEKSSYAEILKEFIMKMNKIFISNKTDLIFLVGDRFEILPVALQSLFKNIPLIHLHGGELTYGAIDDAIRFNISKIAKLHFVTSEKYKKRLIQIGENPKNIVVSGSPILEDIYKVVEKNFSKLIQSTNYYIKKPYIISTYHPETKNPKDNLKNLRLMIKSLSKLKSYKVIFTYPNFDEGNFLIIKHLKTIIDNKKFFLFRSLGIKKYLSFLSHSNLVVGNSSSGIIEAASFKKPVLNLGVRQSGREKSKNIIDCKFNEKQIDKCLKYLISKENNRKLKNIKNIYYKKNSSQIIINQCAKLKIDKNDKKFYDLIFNNSTKFKIAE